MTERWRLTRSALALTAVVGSFAGCLVLTPLDDLPDAPSPGGSAGKSAGTSGSGGVDDGGSGGSGDGGQGPEPGECQTNADCAEPGAGAPYRCRPSDHECVPLFSEACPLVYGPAEDPNAIFFGAFATLNPVAPAKNTIVWSHRLALEELSGNNIGGLPNGAKGKRRPLVMIACDNSEELVDAALEHLADEVQVPALIATLRPGDLRRGFEEHRDRDIFYLSPVAMTDTVASLDDDGLAWNFLGEPADLAPSYAAVLQQTEKYLRKSPPLDGGEPLRVALVDTTDAFDAELSNAVTEVLEFNMQDVGANSDDDNYLGFTIDPGMTKLDELAVRLVEFRPHVIVSTASDPFTMTGGLMDLVETEWQNGEIPGSDQGRPFYILSPYNAGDLTNVETLINNLLMEGLDPLANERVIGISIAGAMSAGLQNSYANRLRSLFPDAYSDSANYYDAVYFLAYAMYGSSDAGELTGPGIASGMQRLLAGATAFDVGPKPINQVFEKLDEAESTIELRSTLGPPSFDPQSGVRQVDGGVFCFERTSTTKAVRRIDVLRYDRELEALTGSSFPCFSAFYP